MDVLKLKPQSIILYIAPSNAGKTHFTTNYFIPQIREQMKDMNRAVNIQHISSDNIRRELLGYNPFSDGENEAILKNDSRMDYMSEQAFALLKAKLLAVTSFPVNADFVVIDTTGLAKVFRDEIRDIAMDVNYIFQPIIFDYRNREDYFKYADAKDSFGRKDISTILKKFREKYVDFTKKEYPNIQKIKSIDFETTKIEVENLEWYKSFFLHHRDEYLVIGDVHQSYDELKEIILKNEFVIDENDLISEK